MKCLKRAFIVVGTVSIINGAYSMDVVPSFLTETVKLSQNQTEILLCRTINDYFCHVDKNIKLLRQESQRDAQFDLHFVREKLEQIDCNKGRGSQGNKSLEIVKYLLTKMKNSMWLQEQAYAPQWHNNSISRECEHLNKNLKL